jgi:hypothetical protein
MLRLFFWRVLLLPWVFSCVMFAGERTTTTTIESNPAGATVYVIHTEKVHDSIYSRFPKTKSENKETMSIQGVTPFTITLAKGKNTKVMLAKEGYKPIKFTINVRRESVYYEGKNGACMGDKYYAWLFGGLWDNIVNDTTFYGTKSDYCKDVRHSYYIHLDPA